MGLRLSSERSLPIPLGLFAPRHRSRPSLLASDRPDEKQKRSNYELALIYTGIVFFLVLAFLVAHSSRMLSDGDPYWHLVVGEGILRTRSFPIVDEYSYTRAGVPWIAKEWLSQVLFSLAYSGAGWFGVTLLTATAAALSYSILFAWLCGRVKPIVALTMTAVTFSLGLNTLLARPEIFFYLLLTLCACGLVGAVEKKTTPWWLVPLVALWANLHASFPIALVLAALFGSEAVVSATPGERVRTGAKWSLVIVAALVATGATPYGYGPLRVALDIGGAKGIDSIDEWRPLGFDSMGTYGAGFIAGSLAILAATRAGWTRAAPIVACAALMVRHVRFFTLFAIVSAPALATPLALRFPRFARKLSAPSAAARKTALAALAASFVAAVMTMMLAPTPVPAATTSPSAALEAARNLHLSGPVFNDYPFGGFLIFKGVKTFIDGRAELYLNGLFEKTRAAELGDGDAAFLSLLDDYHVAWALFVNGSLGAEKLRRSNKWKEIYEDDVSMVFARR
jgi:hypothetical protein